MIIRNMFADDINRKINGVVQVEQSAEEIAAQELKEYVITRELKKHFITFFNNYTEAFAEPTNDTGVWISGFFGSGKSHFLKMLSYLLENKKVMGKPSAEWFRDKFEDDPATFMLIDQATRAETETMLFNIDIEGSINKDKTAVLRVFAKMFYNHLGFYGENLKVAMLEQYIAQQGKTEEFCKVFEEKKGKSWLECRRAFAFHGKAVIPTLMEVLDMSEEDAKSWFSDKSATELSIAQFVKDVKAYVDTKPDNFRLLFMADEVGQYVGTDTDLLLNLQSLVEKLGSECRGKVWVVCTGQEAIDEIIKVRADEFSRIQARFKTRLSLSSSSVDEVIQKRILKKTPEATKDLEQVYDRNDSVLRNLFSFTDSRMDLKGYSGPSEFAVNFPFVPYQFIIMQKVFAEIRKHGNSGKHLSGGERSMLSGFQEATQKIQEQDETSLVPFYRFYDTVHSFLDGSIRRVIERCQKAADNHDGIAQQDVDVLKLLYLIRYIDDIPGNIDNIVILMADHIGLDKIAMREVVRECLNRLLKENYIGRTGEVYNFLTDEEQDIQREISNTNVDSANVVERIGQLIFGDIFTSKKFKYGKYDFGFDQMVDGTNMGSAQNGMRLQFLTVATDVTEKADLRLLTQSKGNAAIVVLSETPYYDSLEKALKIRKYVKQRNVSQLPKSVQDIIHNQQEEANKYDISAAEDLVRAIEGADFYVDGEKLSLKTGTAKSKIDQALEYLVSHVYSELGLIDRNYDSEAEIQSILNGTEEMIPGMEPNLEAMAKVEEFLTIRHERKMSVTMADLQSRYQAVPYGWKDIDIAAVVAKLVYDQKVTVKYGGAMIRPENPKLIDMLRKKTETSKVSISIHVDIGAGKKRAAKELLRDYFDVMDVPDDENGLVDFIIQRFTERLEHYQDLKGRYVNHNYPDQELVPESIIAIQKVLAQKKDNIALIDALLAAEDELFECKEQMQRVEEFFKNQVKIFDEAVQLEEDTRDDLPYLGHENAANEALNKIRLVITGKQEPRKVYRMIPELNDLMDTVRAGYSRQLEKKRHEVLNISSQCMSQIYGAAGDDLQCKDAVEKAQKFYDDMDKKIRDIQGITLLEGQVNPMWAYKDKTCQRIEALKNDNKGGGDGHGGDTGTGGEKQPPKPITKQVYRQAICQAKTLRNEAEIDAYVEEIRRELLRALDGCDEVKIR